jgi:hypothetical protein
MAKKLQTIELQPSADAIERGKEVVLMANLSDLELQNLQLQRVEIKFSVDNDKILANANDPRLATWKPGNDVKYGEHTAAVALIVHGQPPIASRETEIYVIDDRPLALGVNPTEVEEGDSIDLEVTGPSRQVMNALKDADLHFEWLTGNKGTIEPSSDFAKATWRTIDMNAGTYSVTARLVRANGAVVQGAGGPMSATASARIQPTGLSRGDTLKVALQRSSAARTRDQALWSLIRSCTNAISSSNYADFIDSVLCPDERNAVASRSVLVTRLGRAARDLPMFTYGVGAYELLKTATQIFLLLNCGGCDAEIKDLDVDEESARFGETVTITELSQRLKDYLTSGHLPYIDRVLANAFRGQKEITGLLCYGVLSSRVQVPCLLELIWSYWHEEGMMVQAINAVTRRFQNVRASGDRDPLAHLEIDPLRPLNNILWGYLQDEMNLLTVRRRAYEYDHHYGLMIYGKAVPTPRTADSRSKFLEALHNLLHRCSVFYKEDNDTTVIADGFPLLNALKEVHLLLAQGAHNQFGDLPWTARAEMLIQQWLLARPEMRDFLQSRHMVPYKEPWMAQVDTMKSLQGWSDVTVTHFRDLAVYGEQILLSVRYGDWIGINDEDAAKNWARYWRPEIQGYLHAYRAATGVDLTNPDTVDHTMPAVHLQKRLAVQWAR